MQTKLLAEEQHKESSKNFNVSSGKIREDPHYTRWEPKLLYEDLTVGKVPLRKNKRISSEDIRPKLKNRDLTRENISENMNKTMESKQEFADDSTMNLNDPLMTLDTYSKPIFQRAGEFQPKEIRKRYIFTKTHLLQGDGYDRRDREKWVKKPSRSFIKTYEVKPSDVRYYRSRSASSIPSVFSRVEGSGSLVSSAKSSKSKGPTQDLSEKTGQVLVNNSQEDTKAKSKPLSIGNQTKIGSSKSRRSKSAHNLHGENSSKRKELPHQRHHDIRKLKEIFSNPKPVYDRLKRDRETLTQHEKEILMLEKMKNESKEQLEAIEAAQEQLKLKDELTPDQKSGILLKQVSS